MNTMLSIRKLSLQNTLRSNYWLRCYGQDAVNVSSSAGTPLVDGTSTKHEVPRDAEVEHHSKFSKDWWNLNGPMKALHSFNLIRIPFIRDGIISRGNVDRSLLNTTNVLRNQKILEVGCGGGILSEQLARLGATMKGIDLSEELINIAKDHLAQIDESGSIQEHISYEVISIEEHCKSSANHYDALVLSEVIEHIDDKAHFLEACVQCLRPGGSIFITTINQTVAMWLSAIVIGEYMLNLIPRGTHHWEKMISPVNIQRILDTMNCSTVMVNGCLYEFWNNQWHWINSTDMSYALQAIKIS